MCFEIEKKFSEPKIAKSDIVVYKTYGKCSFFGLLFRPGFHDKFRYIIHRATKSITIKPVMRYLDIDTMDYKIAPYDRIGDIEKGYHTYNSIGLGARFSSGHSITDSITAYKFIIPRGTLYFENETECVSEKLIYKGVYKIKSEEIIFLKEKWQELKKARIQEEQEFYDIK